MMLAIIRGVMMINLLWLFWLLVTFFAVFGALENYSKKSLNKWSWRRKLYFSCWSGVALISFLNGLRAFIENPTFNFYAQVALGILFFMVAVVPCGVEFFNKSWLVRRLRDLLCVVIGVTQILFAFHI